MMRGGGTLVLFITLIDKYLSMFDMLFSVIVVVDVEIVVVTFVAIVK